MNDKLRKILHRQETVQQNLQQMLAMHGMRKDKKAPELAEQLPNPQRVPVFPVDPIEYERLDLTSGYLDDANRGHISSSSHIPPFRREFVIENQNTLCVVSDPENDKVLQTMKTGVSNFIERFTNDPELQRPPTPEEILFYIHAVCFGDSHIKRHPLATIQPGSTYYIGELVATTDFADLECGLRAIVVQLLGANFIDNITLDSGRIGIFSNKVTASTEFLPHVWTTFSDNSGRRRAGDPMQFSPHLLGGNLPKDLNPNTYAKLVAEANGIFPVLTRDLHPPTQEQYLDAVSGDDYLQSLRRLRNEIVYWDGDYNYLYSAKLAGHLC